MQLRHFQREIFYPGLSLSYPLAQADRIALTTISHSVSHHYSDSHRWVFPLVLRRWSWIVEAEKVAPSRGFSPGCPGRDGQDTCRAWLAGPWLAPPALAVFSSGRAPSACSGCRPDSCTLLMDTPAPLALEFAGFHDHEQGHLKVMLPVLWQKYSS